MRATDLSDQVARNQATGAGPSARCLEEDPELRWRDVGNVRMQLDDAAATVAAPAESTSGWLLTGIKAPVFVLVAGRSLDWLLPSGPLFRVPATGEQPTGVTRLEKRTERSSSAVHASGRERRFADPWSGPRRRGGGGASRVAGRPLIGDARRASLRRCSTP